MRGEVEYGAEGRGKREEAGGGEGGRRCKVSQGLESHLGVLVHEVVTSVKKCPFPIDYSEWRTHSAEKTREVPRTEKPLSTRVADECPPPSTSAVGVASGAGGVQTGPKLPTVPSGFMARVVLDRMANSIPPKI